MAAARRERHLKLQMPQPLRDKKWALLSAVAVTLICAYPQLVMWGTRGREWNGAYAQIHGDEWIYSAYVQALIDGRPRRNDSYTGRDDRPGQVQPESIFSIQFIPAYVIAIPARILGISSSTAFIGLGIFIPFLSSLAIFWLLHLLVRDDRIAAGGSVIALCFGALAGGQGAIHLLETGMQYFYLPFLRRYAPAGSFPLFFILCGATWKSLTAQASRYYVWAIAGGTSLVLLVFSYYYLWTAALAWLAILTLLWLAARRSSLKQTILSLSIMFGLFLVGMIPYSIMVSHRSDALSAGLKIQTSRTPDLFRTPELIGAVAVGLIVLGVARRIINLRAPETLFTLSFGLLPFIVFNQQIITARSVQPYHYNIFIANYVALLGLILAFTIYSRQLSKAQQPIKYRRLARISVIALWWLTIEVVVHTGVIIRESKLKDPIAGVCQRLRLLSMSDQLNEGPNPRPLVLATNDDLAIMIPTFAPQALLWSQNFDFINIDRDENRKRFYEYLYYSGIDADALREDLSKAQSRFATAVFGHERVIQYLSDGDIKPITLEEIDLQVKQYESFVALFNEKTAGEHSLAYLIFPLTREPNLENLDKWYERYAGEQVNAFKIYRLRLRSTR